MPLTLGLHGLLEHGLLEQGLLGLGLLGLGPSHGEVGTDSDHILLVDVIHQGLIEPVVLKTKKCLY